MVEYVIHIRPKVSNILLLMARRGSSPQKRIVELPEDPLLPLPLMVAVNYFEDLLENNPEDIFSNFNTLVEVKEVTL